jgi:dinuclear metal center YbgI/SA1388 family protein
MPVARDEIIAYLDDELEVARYRDYGPIGLQVAGAAQVEKVAVAVSSTLEVFERAATWEAGLLVVHHGLFWNADARVVDALMRRRLQVLFAADMSLAAYHLPLDGHQELGNNAQLAVALGVAVDGWFSSASGAPLALHGRLREPVPLADLAREVERVTARQPLVFPGGPEPVRRLAICSGAAARTIREAAPLGVDAFVSGEPAEDSRALSLELGVSFLAAGHHATETFGVRAVARRLEERFGLETTFLDVANPV